MDPKIEVSIVPTEHIDTFWRQIEPLLKPAADRSHGRYLVEDIYDSIIQYDSQCWVAHHSGIIVGAAVSHQVFYPRKTVLVVAFWGGAEPLEDWGEALLNIIQRYAKEIGCDAVEAQARMGWSKRIKDYGYKKAFDVFELPIDPISPNN